MPEIEKSKDAQLKFELDDHAKKRQNDDRRKDKCDGFTYISTVGWICRREKNRRKDDRNSF